MRPSSAEKRRERSILAAMEAVHSGMSYREAAIKFHILKSTLWDNVHRDTDKSQNSKRFALSEREEQLVVETLR